MMTVLATRKERSLGTSKGPAKGNLPLRSLLALSVPALLLSMALLLAFLNKAFTIDDPTFLIEARHALFDPFHPSAADMVFAGERARISAGMVSGPIMAWLLVPVLLCGGQEWVAHLIQAALLSLGIVASVALAWRLWGDRRQACLAALFLATTPVVLGMAGTAMPDVAAMSFGVLAMERLRAYLDERRWHQGIAATAALLVAVLSRPHSILLGVCALLWILPAPKIGLKSALRQASFSLVRTAWPLLLFIPLFLIMNYLTRDPLAGHSIANTTLARIEFGPLRSNLVSFLAAYVLVLPLGLGWLVLRWKRLCDLRWLWPKAVLAIGLTVFFEPWPVLWWLLPVVLLGTSALFDVVTTALCRRQRDWLVLVAWLFVALPTAVYAHLPAKYLLPAAPALAMILAAAVCAEPRPLARRLLKLIMLGGLLLGGLILQADARQAGAGRQIAQQVIRPLVAKGEKVWADGAWGYVWYAMEAGAQIVARTPPVPQPGDIVVRGTLAGDKSRYPRHQVLWRFEPAKPGGLVMGQGAGFFSNGFGFLPWTWGRDELTQLEVLRIQ